MDLYNHLIDFHSIPLSGKRGGKMRSDGTKQLPLLSEWDDLAIHPKLNKQRRKSDLRATPPASPKSTKVSSIFQDIIQATSPRTFDPTPEEN